MMSQYVNPIPNLDDRSSELEHSKPHAPPLPPPSDACKSVLYGRTLRNLAWVDSAFHSKPVLAAPEFPDRGKPPTV